MLSKFTVTILNSFFRPPPSNNNINNIFNTMVTADNVDELLQGGIYIVDLNTKGTLPFQSYGFLFVRRAATWIYQDIYYTSADKAWHYHRKKINNDPWTNWFSYITNSDLTQYLSINQYMKNFVIGSKGTKTIQLPSGIFLVSWGQYGAWSDKGTAIVYNSTYQSTASKDIYILFQRETSITLSQSIDGKLTITNSIVAEMPISIIEIGGPKFYDFTV